MVLIVLRYGLRLLLKLSSMSLFWWLVMVVWRLFVKISLVLVLSCFDGFVRMD